MDETAFRK